MKSVCFIALAFFAGISTAYSQSPNAGMNTSYYPNSSSNYNQSYTNGRSQMANQNQSAWSNQNPSTNQNTMSASTSNQPITQPSNIPAGNISTSNKRLGWTDEDITINIRSAIRDDRTLSDSGKSTEIYVKDGNVSLVGQVSTEDEKGRIATIARQTQGVKSVSNNINVKSR